MDKKKLAVIHIVKKELGLSDEEYRDILKKAAGVSTSKDLDERGFRKLMNNFVRSRHYRNENNSITLRQRMFIKGLAGEIGWDDNHLQNFIAKYYQKKDIGNLSKREASKVIESLKGIKSHLEHHLSA
ncbi:MAG: regulatory protein GemA [Nitrospinae bacterium]|nr:regulatory protein GemA [Nitrospinota bacterium]